MTSNNNQYWELYQPLNQKPTILVVSLLCVSEKARSQHMAAAICTHTCKYVLFGSLIGGGGAASNPGAVIFSITTDAEIHY